MPCNKLTKPETIDIEQCKQCEFASEKKIWCCKFGFYFNRPEKKIIQPNKKLILPDNRPCPKPSLMEMTKNFATAMVRWAKSGLKCVDKETYIKRLTICSDCTNCRTCPKCGCILKAKAALATENCPERKW